MLIRWTTADPSLLNKEVLAVLQDDEQLLRRLLQAIHEQAKAAAEALHLMEHKAAADRFHRLANAAANALQRHENGRQRVMVHNVLAGIKVPVQHLHPQRVIEHAHNPLAGINVPEHRLQNVIGHKQVHG